MGSVLDAVELESRDIPTVTISEDAFENEARAAARTHGMPYLPIAVVPRAKGGETEQELRVKAESIFGTLISLLTQAG